ncbi:unnamed protein product [Meloidogyne enterolobii]|uniref:Uncharacterized protein n=1 Tax=Meloidogyne enterolobii TaxID=390850 RepID=A0ACB0Z0Y0_MELEN
MGNNFISESSKDQVLFNIFLLSILDLHFISKKIMTLVLSCPRGSTSKIPTSKIKKECLRIYE